MKRFTYTARASDGSVRRGEMSGASRADVTSRLRRDGLVPLSVDAGAGAVNARAPGWRRALPWALLAVPVVLAGLWFFPSKGKGGKPAASVDKALPSVAERATRTNENAESGSPVIGTEEPAVVQTRPPRDAPAAASPGAVTNAMGGVHFTGDPPPIRGAQRRLAEAIKRGERVSPLFSRVSEGILALHSEPGRGVLNHPLPDNFEQDLLEALKEDIVVTEADTPEDERQKELVAWMKEDVRGFLADGGTVAGYMDALHERQVSGAELYNQARGILGDLIRDGGTEEILAAHKALNGELEAAGIAPLPLPAKVRPEMKMKGIEYAE